MYKLFDENVLPVSYNIDGRCLRKSHCASVCIHVYAMCVLWLNYFTFEQTWPIPYNIQRIFHEIVAICWAIFSNRALTRKLSFRAVAMKRATTLSQRFSFLLFGSFTSSLSCADKRKHYTHTIHAQCNVNVTYTNVGAQWMGLVRTIRINGKKSQSCILFCIFKAWQVVVQCTLRSVNLRIFTKAHFHMDLDTDTDRIHRTKKESSYKNCPLKCLPLRFLMLQIFWCKVCVNLKASAVRIELSRMALFAYNFRYENE